MKLRLNRMGVFSFGLVGAVIYGLFGLIYGVMVFLFSTLAGAAFSAAMEEAGIAFGGAMIGAFALIGFPLLCAVMGFIGGVLSALIYNLAFKVTGGLEMTVDAGTGSIKEFEGFVTETA